MKKKRQKNSIINPIYRVFFIIIAILMINLISNFSSKNSIVEYENAEKKTEIESLERVLQDVEIESEELKNVDTSWRKTIENVEEIARDQLNLIKKDEIVLIPNS